MGRSGEVQQACLQEWDALRMAPPLTPVARSQDGGWVMRRWAVRVSLQAGSDSLFIFIFISFIYSLCSFVCSFPFNRSQRERHSCRFPRWVRHLVSLSPLAF